MSDLQLTENMYPPGWDVKYDSKTEKCYYINYLTKAMQLEDPRIRYRQLQNEHASIESIPMQTSSQTCFTEFQPWHGSPYHVYPINNHPPAVQAFQAPNTASLYNVSTSPLLTNKLQKMEMSPIMRMGSPNISRIIQNFDRISQNGSNYGNYQETSFITQADTDTAVAKINTMFPTASDAHIRLLLKKYLKSIHPKAEEMLLLDILANADNNVQKASEKLTSMGYEKRDTTTPKPAYRAREEQMLREKLERENTPPPKPRLKSNEEKQKIKNQLKGRYKDVAGRIITMALESVDYSEEKASKILEIVMQDDKGTKEEIKHEVKEEASVENETSPPCAGPTATHVDIVDHDERLPISSTSILGDSIINSETGNKSVFKSPWNTNKLSIGPSSTVAKGPNEDLLLADYIAWNGANSELCKGSRSLVKGTDPLLRSSRLIQAQGSKNELCKGPNTTLAKGSIYAQLKMQPIANVKCN